MNFNKMKFKSSGSISKYQMATITVKRGNALILTAKSSLDICTLYTVHKIDSHPAFYTETIVFIPIAAAE